MLPFLSLERPGRFLHALGVLLMTMSIGCVSTPSTQVIHTDSRGTVTLETVEEPAFEATHPISLDPVILTRVLSGIYVRDEHRFLQTLMSGKAVPVRVLSDDQAAYLAPLITRALTQATSLQFVGFRVSDTSRSPHGTIAGTLSAFGHSLSISLTQYRPAAAPSSARSKPGHQPVDPSGLKDRVVLFFPAEARRTDLIELQEAEGRSRSHTIVVDYGLLAGLRTSPVSLTPGRTSSQATPSASPSSSGSDHMRGVEDRLLRQDREIEALREEVHSLQQQLSEPTGSRPIPQKPGRPETPATPP